MSATIPVFVNDRVLELPAGTRVTDAIAALGGEAPAQLAAGGAYVTDARGIRVDAGAALHAGAILRFVVTARRGAEGSDADA